MKGSEGWQWKKIFNGIFRLTNIFFFGLLDWIILIHRLKDLSFCCQWPLKLMTSQLNATRAVNFWDFFYNWRKNIQVQLSFGSVLSNGYALKNWWRHNWTLPERLTFEIFPITGEKIFKSNCPLARYCPMVTHDVYYNQIGTEARQVQRLLQSGS